jgi:hypothetical protein
LIGNIIIDFNTYTQQAVFVWVPYDILVTASMLTFNCTIVLFLGAYVLLKRRNPGHAWIYGHSWVAAIVLSIPILIGSGAMTVFTIIDDYEVLGIPHINLVSFATILGLGVVLHFVLVFTARKVKLDESFADPSEIINLLTEGSLHTESNC